MVHWSAFRACWLGLRNRWLKSGYKPFRTYRTHKDWSDFKIWWNQNNPSLATGWSWGWLYTIRWLSLSKPHQAGNVFQWLGHFDKVSDLKKSGWVCRSLTKLDMCSSGWGHFDKLSDLNSQCRMACVGAVGERVLIACSRWLGQAVGRRGVGVINSMPGGPGIG